MPSIASITAFAGLAGLAIASPVEKLEKRAGAFRINQVQAGTSRRVGALALQETYQKYSKAVPAKVAAAAAAASSGTVVADPEQYDSEYLCPVSVGGTTMNLDFDTGSADLWVFSDKLPSSQQSGHALYKTSASKLKSGQKWQISYGDGSGASGTVYADTVVIGPVTATSQAVEAATSVSSEFVQDTNNDGLVGLSFSSINTVRPTKATTFFDTVKGSLDQALFAADLRKAQAGSYDFGFIDNSKYTGDLVYSSVDSSQGYWMFTADGYSIGGQTGSGSITGIADTGTSLLLLDDSVVDAYWSKVAGSKNDASQGGYTFPCNTALPDFSISIGGQTRTVPGSYINYATVSGNTCFGGIQSDNGIGFSIFGDIFLKSQYVVFDVSTGSPRIGWGQQ